MKLRFLSLVLSGALLIVSCKADKGEVGPAGPAGPAGPQGSTGTANVGYSNWKRLNAQSTEWKDTSIYGLAYRRAILPDAGITADVISKGVVLTYLRYDTETGVNMLPYRIEFIPTGATQFVVEDNKAIVEPGRVILTYRRTKGVVVENAVMTPTDYRYVIIPGAVLTGGRVAGYTPAQLQQMPYEEVVRILGIKK